MTTLTKPTNLAQLQTELQAAGVDTSAGLGISSGLLHTYDGSGQAADFPAAQQSTVNQVITDHAAMRDKTDAELAAEFQASSDPVRKQEIRDMQNGLMPREQVPM